MSIKNLHVVFTVQAEPQIGKGKNTKLRLTESMFEIGDIFCNLSTFILLLGCTGCGFTGCTGYVFAPQRLTEEPRGTQVAGARCGPRTGLEKCSAQCWWPSSWWLPAVTCNERNSCHQEHVFSFQQASTAVLRFAFSTATHRMHAPTPSTCHQQEGHPCPQLLAQPKSPVTHPFSITAHVPVLIFSGVARKRTAHVSSGPPGPSDACLNDQLSVGRPGSWPQQWSLMAHVSCPGGGPAAENEIHSHCKHSVSY